MTYTILLSGGKEVVVEHDADVQQLLSLIKSWRSQDKWVQFITTEGDHWLDSFAIQGFKPHESDTETFGGGPKPESK